MLADPPARRRRRTFGWRGWGLAAALSLPALYGVWAVGPGAVPMTARPIGCELEYADGSCTLPQSSSDPFRVWIDAPPDSQPELLKDGVHRLTTRSLPTSSGVLLELTEPLSPGTLRIYVRKHWRIHLGMVKLRGPIAGEPDWLRKAWLVRRDSPVGGGEAAWGILSAHQSQAAQLTGEVEARYLSLRARLVCELELPDWEKLLRQSIAANQKVGPLSEEAEDVLWLAERLSTRAGRPDEAEKVLLAHHDHIARLPDYVPWELRQQALHLALRGDEVAALNRIEAGRQVAHQTGNDAALSDLNVLGAPLLGRLNNIAQASKWLTEVPTDKLSPCRQIEVLFARAQVALQARESDATRKLPTALGEPVALMNQASGLLKACDQPRHLALVCTYLGASALHHNQLGEAAQWVSRAQARLQLPDHESSQAWQYILGQTALGHKQFAVAQENFLALLKLGQKDANADAEWRAELSLGQTAQAQAQQSGRAADLAEAKRHFVAAETLADRGSLAAPLGLSGGGYLSRYERGTAAYVELLVQSGELTTALQVIRHARVRGIRALAALDRLPRLSQRTPEAQAKYQAAIDSYQQARTEITRLVHAESVAPTDELPRLQEEHERWSDQALRALEAILKLGDLPALARAPQRAPAAGELLLICHPLTARWVCLGADSVSIKSTFVESADLDNRRPRDLLSEKLLVPFKEQLARATRVTVLGYGAQREIDLAMLPFGTDKKLLYTQREVVYALDLPVTEAALAAKAPPAEKGDATLLIDPEGFLPVIQKTAPPIANSLRAAGYQPNIIGTTVALHGGTPGVRAPAGKSVTGDRLLADLGHSLLFHAAVHIVYASTGGWRHVLRLSDDAGVMVSDILALPQVPLYVTLFACESGRTSEEWGNLEGLGMAQAFLARGSRWVVGTERPIEPALAAELSVAFYQALASRHDPVSALRAAIEHSLPGPAGAAPGHDRDVGAFRVYVP